MDKQSHVSIFVKDMRVNVRIGLLDSEKLAPQALDVSVELMAAPAYLGQGAGGDIVDYAQVHDYVLDWEDRPHVEILESLASELLGFCFGFTPVIAVRISVSKPDIFDRAGQAGIGVFMRRDDYLKA